jgi:hypothetical protein
MTSATGSTRISKMAGFLLAGGGASCSSVGGDASYVNVATAAAGGDAQRATR